MKCALGTYLKKLRKANGENMKQMAEKLGVTSAFMSYVENGVKKAPVNWNEHVAKVYHLTKEQNAELNNAIELTNQEIRLNLAKLDSSKKEVSLMFARKIGEVDKDVLKKLKALLEEEK